MSHATVVESQTAYTGAISLADAKEQLRIGHSDLDTTLAIALEAAVTFCEDASGVCLRESESLTQSYSHWPRDPVRFDRQPVKSVDSIKYYTTASVLTTLAAGTDYRLQMSTRGGSLVWWEDNFTFPSLEERPDAVVVSYTAGYDSGSGGFDSVPANGRIAILLHLESAWGNLQPRQQAAAIKSRDSHLDLLRWGSYQ